MYECDVSYASYPALCTNVMSLMLVIQHSVRNAMYLMLVIQHSVRNAMYLMLMAIQCEMVKVCRTMYIVHQIVEDSAEV